MTVVAACVFLSALAFAAPSTKVSLFNATSNSKGTSGGPGKSGPTKPGKGCGDKNHYHEDEDDCADDKDKDKKDKDKKDKTKKGKGSG